MRLLTIFISCCSSLNGSKCLSVFKVYSVPMIHYEKLNLLSLLKVSSSVIVAVRVFQPGLLMPRSCLLWSVTVFGVQCDDRKTTLGQAVVDLLPLLQGKAEGFFSTPCPISVCFSWGTGLVSVSRSVQILTDSPSVSTIQSSTQRLSRLHLQGGSVGVFLIL